MSETPGFALLPVNDIRESATNPRRRFPDAGELEASVREKGILQPVLVRARKKGRAVGFDLVVGARRFRAAKAVGLETVPAVIRELGDEEVLEIQLIENNQRADVHPMEEAEGYERLMEIHGRTVAEISTKIGKSESTIRARLKLLDLCDQVRESFFEEAFSPSIALLLARIPNTKIQTQAAKAVEGDSYRHAREEIERRFLLRLEDALWKLDDADLVVEAGPCTTCPHRTGNQAELFGVADDRDDLCTHGPCYEGKVKAWIARARKEGREVLTGKAAEKATGYKGRLVRLSNRDYEDPKQRTEKRLAGKHLAEADVVLVKDRWRGTFDEWADRAKLLAAKKANGWKPRKPKASTRTRSTPAQLAADRKRKLKIELEQRAEEEVATAIHETLKHPEALTTATIGQSLLPTLVPRPFLFAIAKELRERFYDDRSDGILTRRGIEVPDTNKRRMGAYEKAEKAMDRWMAGASPQQLVGLIAELLLEGDAGFGMGAKESLHAQNALAEAFGIQAQSVRDHFKQRAASYLRALPKPPRKKTTTAPKKAKGKKSAAAKKSTTKSTTKRTAQAKAPKAKKAAGRKAAAKPPAGMPRGLCHRCGWPP